MAFRNTENSLINKSLLLQLAADNLIESEETLKLLFPNLYESLFPKRNQRKHACVQTTSQVDAAHIPWVLEIERKAEHLCVTISNILNSLYHDPAVINAGHVSGLRQHQVNGAEISGNNLVAEISESGFATQFSSKCPVDTTPGCLSETTCKETKLTIEDPLKKVLKLAEEIRSTIPVLDNDTQPKNFASGQKIVPRSFIPLVAKPINKRVQGIITRHKIRRSNSVPDFLAAMPDLGKCQNRVKRQNTFEETRKVTTPAKLRPKNAQSDTANRPCFYCGQYKNGRKEKESSENVNSTGAIPKKRQPVVSARTRTVSQSNKMRPPVLNQPRWK